MMTAIILAGGKSSRMGSNKAFLRFKGKTFIERQIDLLNGIFDEVMISANIPEEYKEFGIPIIVDIYADKGPLGGIYSGLVNSKSSYTFMLACDMPFVESKLIRDLEGYTKLQSEEYDVVVPQNGNRLEPLHAFYSQNCIGPIKKQIENNNLKIIDFFSDVNVKKVEISALNASDRRNTSLSNLNTMEEYKRGTLNDY